MYMYMVYTGMVRNIVCLFVVVYGIYYNNAENL